MVIVGRIGSPHGVQGWVKLLSYTHPVGNILRYPHWFIQTTDGWQSIDMEKMRTQISKEAHIRIKLPGCENPETARLYTHSLIAVTHDQLPILSSGDYYWSDLEGLKVVNTAGEVLGQVSHLFATGSNDVLVVKGSRERLLPYIKDVVLEVDLKKGEVLVDWDADF